MSISKLFSILKYLYYELVIKFVIFAGKKIKAVSNSD